MSVLAGWENFYVIVGSSAGALIGLQFVVMTLIADNPVHSDAERATGAFATPTIVHFSAVLLLSAVVSVPWTGYAAPAIIWAILGLAGMIYMFFVARRMRVQEAYTPEFEDTLFYLLLPFAAYLMLPVSSSFAQSHLRGALFAIAVSALVLLFVGIHNAWDVVTYSVFAAKKQDSNKK
jgi:hypothetical protein